MLLYGKYHVRGIYHVITDIYLFHISGKIPESMQFLQVSDGGSTTSDSHIFNIRIETSLWRCALLTFKFLIILRISSFSKK